jgi:N-acetylglucosamine-6-phosphate deacetylase
MYNNRITSKDVLLVEHGTIVTPTGILESGSVVIDKGKIVKVLANEADHAKRVGSANGLDASNRIVVPGLIDIHTHGLQGGSALDSNIESIRKMSASFPCHGVTGFLPTTVAEPRDMLLETARSVAKLVSKTRNENGAEVLGLNLEGPFISKAKPGAQPTRFIRDPDFEEFEEICEASGNNVRLVTVAPELKGALQFIKRAKAKGVTIAGGHSNATYEEMMAGIDAGITHASHTFNAMREFKHRDPGIIGAILTRDDITAELIADGVHVHEGAVKLLIRAKGVDGVVIVSDSMPPAGMPDGKYGMAGFEIEMKKGVLSLPGGQLAGSASTLDRSLIVMTKNLGISLTHAVKMVTTNPARVIKADGEKGSIEEGKDADLTILNKDLSVHATIVKGRVVYYDSSQK